MQLVWRASSIPFSSPQMDKRPQRTPGMGRQAPFFPPASDRAAGTRRLAVRQCSSGFGSQLPELPGDYYERWRPVATPVTQRRKAYFISRVDKAFKTDPILFTSGRHGCVQTSVRQITADEIEHVRHALPRISERFGHFHRRPLKRIRRAEMTSRQERQPCSKMSW